MWGYEKRLQYPVKITRPNAKAAQIILSQYGGPDGEMGASLRYLSQRYAMPCPQLAGLLTDIGTSVSQKPLRGKGLWRRIGRRNQSDMQRLVHPFEVDIHTKSVIDGDPVQ